MGEREIYTERERYRERERVCVCVFWVIHDPFNFKKLQGYYFFGRVNIILWRELSF